MTWTITRLQVAVFLLIAAFGCILVAVAPQPRHDLADAVEKRIRIQLPDISIERPKGFLSGDVLYVEAPYLGGPGGMRPIARVRPVSADRMRVSLYDEARGDYDGETVMGMDDLVSKVGLRAYRQ